MLEAFMCRTFGHDWIWGGYHFFLPLPVCARCKRLGQRVFMPGLSPEDMEQAILRIERAHLVRLLADAGASLARSPEGGSDAS